ncbi:4-hydroxybenzoate octaprenyltransferase [Shinella sp. BYT-45]|uniref:4-hydroxybenzoate octaprenyltransferase n=1 Tax=Shinella sp. BYT-45 TaxID=3377377 RepID=UPI00397FD464
MISSPSDSGRVADAPSDNWVYRVLPRGAWPYAQLARWDRPIGWQLLMWPCFWSAALAANVAAAAGTFDWLRFLAHLLLFLVGAVAMRGAGCTYNDLVDHDIDQAVARTRSRPLPSGRVTRRQAKVFMALQALAGLLVLLQFNLFTIGLGVASLLIVAVYPFAKRFTDWPQFFLGMAFSWGALMGWAAEFGNVSAAAVALYAAAIAWTIGYDTIYAHQDKEDDALIGVRSTARLFGERTARWLVGLYGLAVVLIALAFLLAGVGLVAWFGLAAAALMLAWQVRTLDIDDPVQCLALFKFNHVVGFSIFLALAVAIPFA